MLIKPQVVLITHKDNISVLVLENTITKEFGNLGPILRFAGNKKLDESDFKKIKDCIEDKKDTLVFLEANLGNSGSKASSFKEDFFNSYPSDVYFALFSQEKIQDDETTPIKNLKNVIGFFDMIDLQKNVKEAFKKKLELKEFIDTPVPNLEEMEPLVEKSGNNEKQELRNENSETEETDEHPQDAEPVKIRDSNPTKNLSNIIEPR